MYEYHDADTAGHPGAEDTLRAIREHHHWPMMHLCVQHLYVPEYVKLCHLCASMKSSAATQANLRPHQPREPWDTIAVDLMGPYPMTGRRKRFILVVTDLFSRWIEAFPLSFSEASVLTKKLEEEVFFRWGYPRVIISDNGPQFLSHVWNLACEKWQVHHWTTAIYHPQANPTERRNQEIKKGLRLHLQGKSHKNWDLELPKILFQLRVRGNAATGYTPGYTLLGKNLRRPGAGKLELLDHPNPMWEERVQEVRSHQKKYQERYAQNAELNKLYEPGDRVYLRSHPLSNAAEGFHAGFAAKWDRPYTVSIYLGGDAYIIDRHGTAAKVHSTQMKLATSSSPDNGHAAVVSSAASGEHLATPAEPENVVEGRATDDNNHGQEAIQERSNTQEVAEPIQEENGSGKNIRRRYNLRPRKGEKKIVAND